MNEQSSEREICTYEREVAIPKTPGEAWDRFVRDVKRNMKHRVSLHQLKADIQCNLEEAPANPPAEKSTTTPSSVKPSPIEKAHKRESRLPFPSEPEGDFALRKDSPYLMRFPGGIIPADRIKALTTRKEGVSILDDHGLSFYSVKDGDTVERITNTLVRLYPDKYTYLTALLVLRKKSLAVGKLKGFNIDDTDLDKDMQIPIPWERENRKISEQLLANYASKAIDTLLEHPRYKKVLEKITAGGGKDKLIALMITTAKQESGDRPLGQTEFHRWEAHRGAFSFSMFHVLMEGAGLTARKNLGMTEGQTYHPFNACQLFLAFIIEKLLEPKKPIDEKVAKIFNFGDAKPENFAEYATFYNGKNWEARNPKYAENISEKFRGALAMIEAGKKQA